MNERTRSWLERDFRHCWHPFTRQDDWCRPDGPALVLTRAEGVWLWDSEGRRYLDGNSSIWTNLHGHGHPRIVEAVARQLRELSHVSFLGGSHPGAVELAERLCGGFPAGTLERVFYSDNGSTAIECALKMALQYRQQTGSPERRKVAAFADAYHGDTMGAASLGGVERFFKRFESLGLEVIRLEGMASLRALDESLTGELAAVVVEPLIQGVNEMRPWPPGMLVDLRAWCDRHGVHLVLDEVMTGFGRTGSMFACQREGVMPDFLCLAKGITGGFLPLAATLTTEEIYDAFRGGAERAFYYGHSYTANPLGCAAALASLEVFESERTLEHLPALVGRMTRGLDELARRHRVIHQVRQCGLIAGIELRRDGERFPAEARVGEGVCLAARRHGLLTRPILDTVVLMPPLATSAAELDHALDALDRTLAESGH